MLKFIKMFDYPASAFFIVLTQLCDRFSYNGIKAILTLYLRKNLNYDENTSTIVYHVFATLCYLVTVVGAIVADTCLGKYRTAANFLILYACGTVVLSVAAIPNTLPQQEFSILALIVIAVGFGCIKPCFTALGGDQFVLPQQEKPTNPFFSMSVFATSAGKLIAIFVAPILRVNIHCFGQDSCFPLAFGVSAIVLVVGVALFMSGKRFYKIKEPEGNIMVDFTKCSAHAVRQKVKLRKIEKRKHWLDFASDKFDEQLIADIKQVLHILALFLPIPIYWALSDQQGSRWTFQATRMDGTIGSSTVKPDQAQIIGPILILALVPFFESLVYPLFAKCGLLTPLQRIGTGGMLAAIAFTLSGILELKLEPTYAVIPEEGTTQLNFINTLPCSISLSYTNENYTTWIEIEAKNHTFGNYLKDQPIEINVKLSSPRCGNVNFNSTQTIASVNGASTKAYSLVIFNNDGTLDMKRMTMEEPLEKDPSGLTRLNFITSPSTTVTIVGSADTYFSFAPIEDDSKLAQTDTRTVDHGSYDVWVTAGNHDTMSEFQVGNLEVKPGGCYTVFIHADDEDSDATNYLLPMEITKPNSISMLWQLPQRFIISVAEVMLSVSGLNFAFTQAPERMKSVVQAFWYLTVALGNTFIIIIAKLKPIDRQSTEFFLYAGLMVLDMLWFFFLAHQYTYVGDKPNSGENTEGTAADDCTNSAVAQTQPNMTEENSAI